MNKGELYEKTVVDLLKQNKTENIILEENDRSAFDSSTPDLVLKSQTKHVIVELKLDHKAQMGGTSIQFANDKFTVDNLNSEIGNKVLEILNEGEYRKHLEILFEFLRKQPPDPNEKIDKIPINVSKNAWLAARQNKLLVPFNLKIPYDISFVLDHYRSKNVSYIQIGKCGLFAVDDILDLGVPKLEGIINVELRLGRSGSSPRKEYPGYLFAAAGLRAQARLKFKPQSSISLDNKEGIIKLLEKMT